MLDKTFRPESVEARQYARWEAARVFHADPDAPGEPYAIMIPPPNVTGSLHIGHAFNNTIQDILIRYHRMQGRNVLWQPGTDHAGIATQMVVERQLAEQGIALDRGVPPRDTNVELIGREAFVAKVWEWRAHSGGQILQQLRRLGASCDWDRERFTMDEGLSRAVLKVFVQLYQEGLIYKDKRLVNWDPKFHTAISDLEVEQVETRGHLWHFRYPIEGEEGRFIVVATTRPETMLGDTAVAVHPDDDRYRDLVGKFAILPLVGRRIPIVADDYADPEQGSGAVKITPAHDFNDFEVGRRHNLEVINIFDRDARIKSSPFDDFSWGHRAPDELGLTHADEDGLPGPDTIDLIPERYRGMDRFTARKAIVADMEGAGLLEKVDDHTHTVPHGDRSGVPVEPYLTEQWFADAPTLAKPCIEAVEQGDTRFVPDQFAKIYFQWMRNIQPWCISRQLWWGHQIPAWYDADGKVFVEESEEQALESAVKHYLENGALTEETLANLKREGKLSQLLVRDTDVLDTWFSSALWPFSTLGWPDQTPELDRFYPGSCLVTGEDIIFFWVARMMMMGMHFMRDEAGRGRVPFADVYIHGLVRDEKGQKYSKSKGNVVDPLDLLDEYGADAVRFTLASLAVQGRDIKLAATRIAGYRNFATKIWNAARYCEMNDCAYDEAFRPELVRNDVNRWIVSQVAQLEPRVRAAIEGYRFNEAAHALYQFVWHTYCDWYLEFSKPLMASDDADVLAETRATALWALHQALFMLHPFMPFLTEELWEQSGGDEDTLMTVSDWPTFVEGMIDEAADAQFGFVTEFVSEIRSTRSDLRVPPKAKPTLFYVAEDETFGNWVSANNQLISATASASSVELLPSEGLSGHLVVSIPVSGAVGHLQLEGIIDKDDEVARLQKDIEKIQEEIAKLDKKLANESFVAKAPPEVVEEQRERKHEAEQAQAKLTEALNRLAAA